MSQSPYIKCPDCDRICASQGNLGLHRSKMHKIKVPDHIKSVNIVRLFPEGKSHYCCLCNTIIGSFPNFKRHFSTAHKGISLNISAKCVICNREFEKSSGAGVHVKRSHKIGKDGKYPLSPSPVMSFIDMSSSHNNSCARSRRSRTVTLVNSPLSGISKSHTFVSSTDSNPNTTADGESTNIILSRSIVQVSPPLGSNTQNISSTASRSHISENSHGIPPPLLLDIDLDEDPSEVLSSSPPRPCHTPTPSEDSPPPSTPYPLIPTKPQSPISPIPEIPLSGDPGSINTPSLITHHQPSSDTGVAFIGCTAESCPVQSNSRGLQSPITTIPVIPLTGDSDSTNIPSTIAFHQPPSDPRVAFVGCTVESRVVQSSSDVPNDSSLVNDNPSTCMGHRAANNLPNLEPPVALSGCTVGDRDKYNTTGSTRSNNSRGKDSEFVRQWHHRISSAASFEDFSTSCGLFAEDVVTKGKEMSSNSRGRPTPNPRNRPNGRVANRNRRPLQFNPRDAKRLQILYRLSKKRAARQVLNDSNTPYSGTKDRAEQYFTETFSPSSVDLDELLHSLCNHVPSAAEDPSIMAPMTQKEIKSKLTSMSNSAPGKDKVEYRHLKLVDPNCKVLGAIFNKCLSEHKIPATWKSSTTILIYKKGPGDDPSNFRPIALMSCLYKLFTSILSARVSNFAINNNLLSSQQKSARPSEGCHEHTFTLQSVVADCKRNRKNCFFAWLDLRNAFGSVSHDAIYVTLKHMGFSEQLIDLVKDIYTDAETVVKLSKDEETDPIMVNAGVKQGCPISPILFNLTTELLIRTVQSRCNENSDIAFKLHGNPVYVLAYADDLVLVSRTRNGLQTLLNDVSFAANILQLSFRPDKCATLSLTCNSKREPSRVGDTVFSVQDGNIPVLLKEESYRYLGVPIGLLYDANDMGKITDKLIKDLEKIRDSLLAPWQKLDAVRTFIQPCLTYVLRTCPVTRESLKSYRSKLIDVLRSICHLPKRSTTHYFFADKSVGGLGLQDPFDERHIQSIVHSVKILAATDTLINKIAKAQLKSVVYRCFHRDPTDDEIGEFLSGSMNGELSNHSKANNSQTLWSRCRIACRAMKVKVKSVNDSVMISVDNFVTSADHKSVAYYLHHRCLKIHADQFKDLPDQGKAARCFQENKISSTHGWCYDGTGIRFCDWRFIHRARTNTLPTNDVKSRWFDDCSPKCRRCHSDIDTETLPHIICNCRPNMVKITARHDAVLKRLADQIKEGDVVIDQVVPGAPGEDRPDIVVRDGDKAIIIDVTCPFENGKSALSIANNRKKEKYGYLIDFFASQNVRAKVFGFVVGALGGWFADNEKVLNEIGMPMPYRTLFRKLCCSDVIKGSRNIYVEHLTGVPQV